MTVTTAQDWSSLPLEVDIKTGKEESHTVDERQLPSYGQSYSVYMNVTHNPGVLSTTCIVLHMCGVLFHFFYFQKNSSIYFQ